MEVTVRAWVATIAVIVVLLGVDLPVGALRPHPVGFAGATAWSVFPAESPADRRSGTGS